ncbi:DUF488 domain-containing protein [Ornatilinea apprima]|uniref:DUF488 domain-containing protein n=1 Tax=Ornatilinea apprima TaxID=1134406 RepID=UPI0009465D60|nr:DUF488 domain-containing protein [Ornatilinea apprima]
MVLATIGYEGLNIEEFFEILKTNGIETLVDIRELPLSRKPGFSKKSLSERAKAHQIKYLHLSSLGCPKEIRHDYRKDNDWIKYSKRFLAYLRTQSEEIRKLIGLVRLEKCCLLCFEADYHYCHRRYVADEVLFNCDYELDINHLGMVKTEPVAWLRPSVDISSLR